jgi:hypothetical protein
MKQLYENVLRGEPVFVEDETGYQPRLLAV